MTDEPVYEKTIPVPEEDDLAGVGDDLFGEEVVSKASVVPPPSPVGLPDQEKKAQRVKKTLRQKAMRVMLKRAGISKLPPIEKIIEGRTGLRCRISDIGFISNDNPSDPLIVELAKSCPVRNRLNRDDVLKARVLVVGSQILKAGRMWTPIHVCKNSDDGRMECIGGRHRMAFLALAYGPDTEIPFHVEVMSLNAAREATAVANDSRPIKALERASYAILRAVGGDSEADQDKVYVKLATQKINIVKYCVYSVIDRGYPSKIAFKMAERSSRPNGEITTVSNIESFWSESFAWTKDTPRKEFDAELKDSVAFLNAFVSAIRKVKGFDPSQHLSAGVMEALGRYYLVYRNITSRNAIEICGNLALGVVGIGKTSKKQQGEIYNLIAGCVAEK